MAKKSGGRSGELLKLFGQVHREKGGGKELARPVYALGVRLPLVALGGGLGNSVKLTNVRTYVRTYVRT